MLKLDIHLFVLKFFHYLIHIEYMYMQYLGIMGIKIVGEKQAEDFIFLISIFLLNNNHKDLFMHLLYL